MPVPKRKTTHSKKKMRSAGKSLKKPGLSFCPKCMEPKLPHHLCESCGHYKGKQILKIEEE